MYTRSTRGFAESFLEMGRADGSGPRDFPSRERYCSVGDGNCHRIGVFPGQDVLPYRKLVVNGEYLSGIVVTFDQRVSVRGLTPADDPLRVRDKPVAP